MRTSRRFARIITAAAAGFTALTLIATASASARDVDTVKRNSAQRRTEDCRGRQADRVVMPGENVQLAGDDEVVIIYGPADVEGFAGTDRQICVYDDPHADYHTVLHLYGDADDTILTYTGASLVYAGDGDDHIYSNTGDNLLDGEGGDDDIWLGMGAGVTYAGDGNDTVWGSPNADTIYLGAGNDLVWGFEGSDDLSATSGTNTFFGGMGWDDIQGGTDWDTCKDYAGAEGADMHSCEDVELTPQAATDIVLGG